MERRLKNQAIFRRKEVVRKSALLRCPVVIFALECVTWRTWSIWKENATLPASAFVILAIFARRPVGRNADPVRRKWQNHFRAATRKEWIAAMIRKMNIVALKSLK